MNLAHRLRRLEACSAAAGLRRCAECGGPADWRNHSAPPGDHCFKVVHGSAEPLGPDKCEACGRSLVIKVEFDRGGAARVAALAWIVALAALALGAVWRTC